MKYLFFLFFVCSSIPLRAQWTDGGRTQTDPQSANGSLFVHDGVMYYFNFENYMQRSTNNGVTWTDLSDAGLGDKGPGLSRTMSKMEYNNGRLYGAFNYGNSGAILYSTDGGDSWLPDTLGAPAGPSQTDPHPVVVDFEAWGHWVYTHWTGTTLYTIQTDDGPHVLNTYMAQGANNPTAVASSGDTLFVLTGSGLYYTIDGGANFITPANTGFIGNLPKQLIKDGSRLYATMHLTTTPKYYTLLYSDDHGEHWTQIDISQASNQKLGNGSYVVPIATFVSGTRIEMAFGQTGFNMAPNVWRSTDLGATWNADTVGLPNLYAESVQQFAYTPDGYLWAVRQHEAIYKQKIDAGEATNGVAIFQERSLMLSPNPCHGTLNIPSYGSYKSYRIINTIGLLESHGDVNATISTSSLAGGQYWLILADRQGHTMTVPFVKE
jgi:photosystem II stability/assembly factor-like uncharacterized protein